MGTTTEKLVNPAAVEIKVAETGDAPVNATVADVEVSGREKRIMSPGRPALAERLVVGSTIGIEFARTI